MPRVEVPASEPAEGATEMRDLKRGVSSCEALRHAVSSLYRLDDFHREQIGSGFFSQVYKVRHRVTGKVMVLKMNTNFTNRPNMLREVQLMNRLNHPNVLRFMGVCVHEGQLHALTEFINGGSLEDLLADITAEIPWHERLRLAADIAKGMRYLHARRVMHRDLTSKNILVREKNREHTAIVGDFGLACKVPDPLTEKDKALPIVGSPYWMSPECITGQIYNEKADVFSYGIILCELLARVEADPDVLPRTKHFGVDYVKFSKMVEGIPQEFLGFLHLALNCCQIDPKKRQSFIDIVDSLEELKSKSQMAAVLADISSLQVDDHNMIDKDRLDRVIGSKKMARQVPSMTVTLTKEISPPHIDVYDHLPGHLDHGNMTPQVVAEFISQQDEYYTPHRNNPFIERFKHGGVMKLVGSIKENWNAWFELPSPSRALTPPATPSTPDDSSIRDRPLHLRVRQCHSLPGSPTMNRKEFDRFHDSSSVTKVKLTNSVLARKIEGQFGDEMSDCRSDTSSNDSALGLDFFMKDFQSFVVAPHSPLPRKLSIEPSLLNSSVDRYRSRNELLALRDYQWRDDITPLRLHAITHDRPRSWLGEDVFCSTSSSESCISLEDAFVMSPSSSYSSYNDLDSELVHLQSGSQLDLYQTRLHSRERFQELVKVWEAKELSKTPPAGHKHTALPTMHTPTFRPRCFWSCSLESCDYYMERVRKFQELRRKWELQQQRAPPADCVGIAPSKLPSTKNYQESIAMTTKNEQTLTNNIAYKSQRSQVGHEAVKRYSSAPSLHDKDKQHHKVSLDVSYRTNENT